MLIETSLDLFSLIVIQKTERKKKATVCSFGKDLYNA
jgi:hypothetical protein